MTKTAGTRLPRLMVKFDTTEECRTYLEELRWPEGPRCPRCQSNRISKITKRGQFDCDACRYQFSVTAGTIFHDSHLPLPKWFAAIFLMCEAKNGVSANQLKRVLGVSYKTAWYLCHRVRAAMKDASTAPLSGTVEVDETYVGGARRDVGQGYKKNKTVVMGALQRGGEVRLRVEKRRNRTRLHGFIKDHLADTTERIFTDEYAPYDGIADANTTHETVNHRQDEWVHGDVHTNGMENVRSLLKRSIVGSYHRVSAKHLPAYLDELEFRFNNRKNKYLFRDTLLRLLGAGTLPYRVLVEESQ